MNDSISVRQASEHIDLNFLYCLIAAIVSLFAIFPYCYAATNAFECIKSLNASVFTASWYELPVKYQHYTKLMLIPAQRARELSGYDLINCSLETFRKVNMDFQFFFQFSRKITLNVLLFINMHIEKMLFTDFEIGWIAVCYDKFDLKHI